MLDILRRDLYISIHAPRVGSDDKAGGAYEKFNEFQSTLPAWGATQMLDVAALAGAISIHAPRVGSDYVERR